MDIAEAEAQVRTLAQEWARQTKVRDQAALHSESLRKIIGGYIDMFPSLGVVLQQETGTFALWLDSAAVDGPPRGAEAVRLILQESPDEPFLVSELVTALRDRGWLPESDNPANAVRAALERLINTPESDVKKWRRFGKVVYAYRPDDAPDERPADEEAPANDEEPF